MVDLFWIGCAYPSSVSTRTLFVEKKSAREKKFFFFSQDCTFSTSESHSESCYTFRPAFLPPTYFPLVKYVQELSLMISWKSSEATSNCLSVRHIFVLSSCSHDAHTIYSLSRNAITFVLCLSICLACFILALFLFGFIFIRPRSVLV